MSSAFISLVSLIGLAQLAPHAPSGTENPCVSGSALAGGLHAHWATRQGPVHLWCPSGLARSLEAENAAGRRGLQPLGPDVVVYVHGYWDDVNSAFAEHRLAEQFAASGVPALFVVVSAPSGPRQPVRVRDLDGLLAELQERAGLPLLAGQVLIVGHSGAYRTIWPWLASARTREIVLLDAFYGATEPLERWLWRRGGERLRIVSRSTQARAEAWLGALTPPLRPWVQHELAGCSHQAIVTGGVWLERVLRESSLGARTARW